MHAELTATLFDIADSNPEVFKINLFFFATPCGLWDLISLTRDRTQALDSERALLNTGLPGTSLN